MSLNAVAIDGYLSASEQTSNLALSGSVSDPAAGDSTRNTAVGRSLSLAFQKKADATVLHTLSATVKDDGTWSASLPSNLVQGLTDATLTVRASYTSLYGGSVSATRDLVVDTTAPSLTLTTPSDTALTGTNDLTG